MERSLEISRFRNIGLKRKEKLILNRSMKKGEMGDLIILIGANNSGKSNVLDALMRFKDKNLTERDITLLSILEEDRKPSLSLVTKDGDDRYSYSINFGLSKPKIYFNNIESKKLLEKIEKNKKTCEIIINVSRSYGNIDNECIELNNDFSKENITQEELVSAEEKLKRKLNYIKNNTYDSMNRNIIEELNNYVFSECDEYKILEKEYKKRYDIAFMPTILKYTEEKITNSNLRTSIQNISNSNFMKSLLKIMDVDVKNIDNAYKDYYRTQNKGVLVKLSNELNEKLKDIAKQFNTLYYLKDDNYTFEIDCESTQIDFLMKCGDNYISLDYQSVGFKWFFNLYFNLLASSNLQPGDIIIMDEPATNLHTRGQEELRKLLKEFAIKNDLTIILATHSPFLIDIDNLDELRVISPKETLSIIDNDFSTINSEDPDSLKSIKEALTINNHILFDPDKKIIFVEGITDYNYLSAFKKILKYDDLVFLPINGIGKATSNDIKQKQIEISKSLMKIKKHNPILLVDGDGAGKSMQKINKNDSGLEVITLSDIESKFNNIEDLFSNEDLDKFYIKDKKSSLSALFKNHHANKEEISEETLNNFEKVFSRLMD